MEKRYHLSSRHKRRLDPLEILSDKVILTKLALLRQKAGNERIMALCYKSLERYPSALSISDKEKDKQLGQQRQHQYSI